jgi:hypothetical protein
MIKNAEEVKKKDGVFSEEALSIIKPGWVGPVLITNLYDKIFGAIYDMIDGKMLSAVMMKGRALGSLITLPITKCIIHETDSHTLCRLQKG